MNCCRRALIAVLVLTLCRASTAQLLNAGSAPPPFKPASWIQGAPITGFTGDALHVVTFWGAATDPGLKITEILTEVAKRHGPAVKQCVVVVGAADPTGLKAALGAGWFSIAADPDGSLAGAWMRPADERETPCSFIIGKNGKISWIGDPRAGMEVALYQMMNGKFPLEAYAADRAKEKAEEARYRGIMNLSQAGKHREAVAALDKWMTELGDKGKRFVLVRFYLLLKADEPAAYKYGRVLLNGELKDQSGLLWLMARSIVDDTGTLKKPDYTLALDLSKRAADITKYKDANIMTALAFAYYKLGNLKMALQLQEKATPIGLAHPQISQPTKDTMKKRLELYRRKAAGK